MNLLTWVFVIIGTLLATGFNYILNLAPGSDPEDFQIGPREMNITCDCQLNILIVGGIMILALSAVSGAFTTREELYIVGGVSFAVITIAGYIGRRKRYREWKELKKAIRRAFPSSYTNYRQAPVDIMFEDDDEEEDNYGYGEP